MTGITEEQLHKSLTDFISDSSYKVKFLKEPCEKDHKETIEHFINEGFEVFPSVMTTEHKECSIFLRKKNMKSPINKLFFELFGYYPNKAGQSFEMIVAAAFKLLLNKDVTYDQKIRGDFSKTVYQLDGLIIDGRDKSMIEAKDYTVNERKVGRSEI